MVIAEISVVPVGTQSPSVSRHVARAIKALARRKDVKYRLAPMGTVLEGELDAVLEAAKAMHQAVFGDNVTRVVTHITLDDRCDKPLTMEYKVRSVKEKLGKG